MLIREMVFVFYKSKQVKTWATLKKLLKLINTYRKLASVVTNDFVL